jgi:beta-1,2-mannobiose phosphorylase / 1,2-beta-oligomannan phosphorylase
MPVEYPFDQLVFTPLDVDLAHSPLRPAITAETYVLGAFNPGLTRLPNGNLVMMVRIAEALRTPVENGRVRAIRWVQGNNYVLDEYDLSLVDAADPRKFHLLGYQSRVMALTSLSWLLPVELSADGTRVLLVHYDKIIAPQRSCQQYGVEDARISKIGDTWYMTACSVGSERHCTTLYTSTDGLNYSLQGIVLDHQNKDMLYFEGLVDGKFHALTRPLGDLYFACPPGSRFSPGPSINLAVSPDGLHWRPHDSPLLRPRRGSTSVMKIGGGTQPIRTPAGWLLLYHGVEPGTLVGVYRTFWALLDLNDPSRILQVADEVPVLESNPALTQSLKDLMYLSNVVFTCGLADGGDHYIVASGEVDLACRITHMPKSIFV